MSPQLRSELKAAIDGRRRELLGLNIVRGHGCRGCGCPYDERSDGCVVCYDRHHQRRHAHKRSEYDREYRSRPEVRERRRVLNRIQKAKLRERRRAEAK